MNLQTVGEVFRCDSSFLPDIFFDFDGSRLVAAAYERIQANATSINEGASYWSKTRNRDCPIQLGENPAMLFLEGEAESIHVVFGGITSRTGAHIPDLGVSVLNDDLLALDYSMGSEWSESAILGLFELMDEIAALSPKTVVTHDNCVSDPEGTILVCAFNEWRIANQMQQ